MVCGCMLAKSSSFNMYDIALSVLTIVSHDILHGFQIMNLNVMKRKNAAELLYVLQTDF